MLSGAPPRAHATFCSPVSLWQPPDAPPRVGSLLGPPRPEHTALPPHTAPSLRHAPPCSARACPAERYSEPHRWPRPSASGPRCFCTAFRTEPAWLCSVFGLMVHPYPVRPRRLPSPSPWRLSCLPGIQDFLILSVPEALHVQHSFFKLLCCHLPQEPFVAPKPWARGPSVHPLLTCHFADLHTETVSVTPVPLTPGPGPGLGLSGWMDG